MAPVLDRVIHAFFEKIKTKSWTLKWLCKAVLKQLSWDRPFKFNAPFVPLGGFLCGPLTLHLGAAVYVSGPYYTKKLRINSRHWTVPVLRNNWARNECGA